MQVSDDSEELVLAIDSDKAFLCQEDEGGKLKVDTVLSTYLVIDEAFEFSW